MPEQLLELVRGDDIPIVTLFLHLKWNLEDNEVSCASEMNLLKKKTVGNVSEGQMLEPYFTSYLRYDVQKLQKLPASNRWIAGNKMC